MNETAPEKIRRAAKLMRERATEAEQDGYGSDHPGQPWCPSWTYTAVRHVHRNMSIDCSEHPDEDGSDKWLECNQWGRYAGYHIAGMTPAVGIALADVLENEARAAELAGEDADSINLPDERILTLARIYLGEKP